MQSSIIPLRYTPRLGLWSSQSSMVVRNVICFFSIYQLYLHEQMAKSRLMKVCYVAWGYTKAGFVCSVDNQSCFWSGSLDPLASIGLALQQVALQPFLLSL